MKYRSHTQINQYKNYLMTGSLIYSILLITSGMVYAQTNSITEDGLSLQDDNIVGIESTVLYSAIDTSNLIPEYSRSGEPLPVLSGINQREHAEKFKSETIETILNPRQQIEYMASIEQGEVLLFSWQVDGKIYFDFHAHQDDVNPDVWIRYSEGVNINNNGSIVAPYTGEHGWYWVNLDTKPVTLILTVSGYYKNILRHDL